MCILYVSLLGLLWAEESCPLMTIVLCSFVSSNIQVICMTMTHRSENLEPGKPGEQWNFLTYFMPKHELFGTKQTKIRQIRWKRCRTKSYYQGQCWVWAAVKQDPLIPSTWRERAALGEKKWLWEGYCGSLCKYKRISSPRLGRQGIREAFIKKELLIWSWSPW